LWILARAKVVEWDEDGSPLRIVGTSLDISDRKRADEALQKAHDELERRVEERTAELASANQRLEREIGERKKIEEALRESEVKFRSVVQTTLEGVCVVQNATLKFVNRSIAMFMGYPEDELIGRPFTDFVHADDSETVYQRYSQQLAGQKQNLRFSFRVVDSAGNVKWLNGGTALISWEGKPAVSLFAIDISQRKRVEEALKESEKRYRELVDKANDIIYLADVNGHFLLFNAVGLKITGYSQEEIVHKHYLDLIHGDYKEQVAKFYGLQFVKRIPDTYYEVPIITHEGKTVWIGQNVQLVMEGDTVVGFQAICRDVTDRKRAEEELRESEERYRAIFNNAAIGINLSDRDTRFLQVNSRSASMLGYTQEELKALTVLDITHPDHRELSMANLSDLIDGKVGSYRVQKRYVRKDGQEVWADVHVSAIHNQSGEFVASLAVVEDITDRKRAEQERERMRAQLLQAQKMEAIGTLTGGMAHEFNNLLTIVSGYAELLLAEKNESDPEHSDLQRIVHASQRGAELVRSLLAFSRKSEMNITPVNINREVEQVKKLLDRTLPKMIEIELNLSDGLKTVEADAGQIRQLLMNMALNARDAMPDGGKLSIGTNNFGEEDLSAPSGAKPGDYVLLTVSDTGIGMDGETVDRIFEPFYTTKGLAYQTGLGLAVVHGIIEQHGGYIRCDTKPKHGTTFQIYLPTAQPRKAIAVSVKAQPLGGTETILIVDDEEYVRDLASRFLERAGYRVITAEDSLTALGLYDNERSDISLVILDLIMPKMGGKQFLEELLKIDPKLKVLIASGYSDTYDREELVRAGARGFVGKPFHMTELLQALRDVLDAD